MKSKKYIRFAMLSLYLFVLGNILASAQTTEFTYQGRLLENGLAATANYDMQFRLFDDLAAGNQKGPTLTVSGVSVSNGIFTVHLDFGPQFAGNACYLQIGIRPAGSPNIFTDLNPRQPLTSAPYSVRSLEAATADLATNSSQLGGVPSSGFIHNGTTQQGGSDFNISGNGTLGGALSANTINAASEYDIANNRVLSVPGNNTFVGPLAGQGNTTGSQNTFVGYFAGTSNTTGVGNSFFGSRAGEMNTAGSNSFFGDVAGNQNTTGAFNSIFGYSAGSNGTTGSSNAFFGIDAGKANITGSDNSFFGSYAGLSSKGNKNSVFGRGAQTGTNVNNGTAIGAYAYVGQDNSLVLGGINGVNFATADTSVGIGTTAPKAPLHIAANGTNTLIGYAGCLPGYGGVGFASSLACGNFSLSGNGTDTVINRPTGGSIYFNQNNFTEASISPAGNLSVNNKIGIGTTTPDAPLHIAGNGTNVLAGSVTAGCAPGYAGIGFGPSLNCLNVSLVGNGTDTTINRPSGGSIYFMQNAVPEAGISPAGNLSVNNRLGIGTAAPTAQLHIAGNGGNVLAGSPIACGSGYTGIGFAGSLTCNNYSVLGNGNDTIINSPAGGAIFFKHSNTTQASISATGDLAVSNKIIVKNLGSTGFLQLCVNALDQISACASSLRYKKDLQPFTRGLALLDQLNPITFRWKSNNMLDLGFGAEDIAKVEPLLVTHNATGEVEGVKYDRISAVLVNSVKEQQAQIASLKKQVQQQQILIDGMKKLVCQKNVRGGVCK